MGTRHFLDLSDAGGDALAAMLNDAIDRKGARTRPTAPKCIRFECYTFDVIPQAEPALLVEAQREEEYYPLRASRGRYSPEEVRQAMSERFAGWLESAGVEL